MDLDQRTRGIGGRSGRIILLGDGTEVLTDSDETDMFDHEEEDKDLDSQVPKGGRGDREETPGPEPQQSNDRQQVAEPIERNSFDEPSSKTTENPQSETTIKNTITIPESALPDKLVTPPISQEEK